MATFTKKIISPGVYVTSDGKGKKTRHYVGKNRIKAWVDNFKKMSGTGLRVPAPWRHDPKAQPFRTEADEQDVNAFQNAGYWKDLWQEKDGSLYGKVTVPLRRDASRVGRTVTEVSPLVKKAWADGDTDYQDAITHIAFVTHPVVKNQENFTKEEEQELAAAVAFSSENLVLRDTEDLEFSDSASSFQTSEGSKINDVGPDVTSASGANVSDAINILRALGLGLPKDTTEDNFLERVVVAAVALKTAEQHEMNPQGQGSQIQQQPSPVALSKEESIMPDKTESKDLKLSAEDQAAINFGKTEAKKSYLSRIETLVNTGKVTKDYATKTLAPMVQYAEIAFSAEGNLIPNTLDHVLDALSQSISVPLTQNQTGGTTVTQKTGPDGDVQFSMALGEDGGITVQEMPDTSWADGEDDDISDEESEKIMQKLAKNTGYSWMAAS